MARWIFDPLPPSGSRQGGISAQHVFRGDLEIFVREVLQNSGDQRSGDDPVQVRFSLIELSGERRKAFLNALSWHELEGPMRGPVSAGGQFGARIQPALQELSSEPLRILRIDDFRTRGLEGEEDGTDSDFANLCGHVLVSSDDDSERGVSFGLGKAVLGNFSAFSTVLFSSLLIDVQRPRFRFIAKCELPIPDESVAPTATGGPPALASSPLASAFRGPTGELLSIGGAV